MPNTWFIDTENGSDAAAGTSFVTRRKSITGLTAAFGLAAGDEVRIMASPDPTLVGSATWTQYSKDVVLAAPVTQTIADCETAWTAAANVTATTSTANFKEGTRSANLAVAAAFTTGKIGYFATGTLNLSAYQQISFWIRNTVAVTAGMLELRLCSDAAGDVAVHALPIPAIPSTAQFVVVTVDVGAALSSSVASVALHALTDPGTNTFNLDCIIACKASSAPDSLTLSSLIGKICNVSWSASTAYAAGDQRRPTQPMRNGFRYQASAGTTGATEPAWPQEIGASIVDGGVTWTCVGLEDSWFGIQSINGTTVKLDNFVNTIGSAGRGYAGATETVATYKREAIKTAMVSGSAAVNTLPASGTDVARITYSGGWDRVSMSAQSGETWSDGQNGSGIFFVNGNRSFIRFVNLNGVRYSNACTDVLLWEVSNFHWNNLSSSGFSAVSSGGILRGRNVALNNSNNAIQIGNHVAYFIDQFSFESHMASGVVNGNNAYRVPIAFKNFSGRNNAFYAIHTLTGSDVALSNGVTGNNASGAYNFFGSKSIILANCLIPESTQFVLSGTNNVDCSIYSQKHNQVADSHLITTDGGTIVSATDQRYGSTGISWKFRPTTNARNSAYPMALSIGKIRCVANQAVSLTIPVYRDSVNIKGQLVVVGGQVAGVSGDVVVACEPAPDAWAVSAPLVFTPTEDGVVEIVFRCWDGIGTTNNFWISARDLTRS